MKQELNYEQLRNAVIEARETHDGEGWLLVLEAMVIAYLAFRWWDNAIIALVVFVITFGLLINKVVGTLVSIAYGGIAGYWIGHIAFQESQRWDIGAAAGIVVAFFVFTIHQAQVKAFEKF